MLSDMTYVVDSAADAQVQKQSVAMADIADIIILWTLGGLFLYQAML
jgi:hypothetical protein